MRVSRLFFAAIAVFTIISFEYATAASINFGGIRLRLPEISVRPDHRYREGKIYSHSRWGVVVQEGLNYAYNGTGIWIGYDERGDLVLQIELLKPTTSKPKTEVPVQLNINGRYYDTVKASVANEKLVVVHGSEVERILGRLSSGRNLGISVEENFIETHLKGSSAALRAVRRAAAVQRRLYAAGKVKITDPEEEDHEGISFFLPGVANKGNVNVTFNIIKDSGLVIYMTFSQIKDHGDPEYRLALTSSETKRAIPMICKAENWTEIAVKNRVGLFSKTIGYIDDANGSPVYESKEIENSVEKVADDEDDAFCKGKLKQYVMADGDLAEGEGKADPEDFKAVNFNSYEDGSTSVQIENSLKGFSRRFNLELGEALELAKTLDSTLEYASFRLKNRDLNSDEKGKLFK